MKDWSNLAFGRSREKLFHSGLVTSLAAVVFFLPLKIYYANVAVGFAVGFWLLNFRLYKLAFHPGMKLALIIFLSIYGLQVVGILYTDDLREGWRILEKKLPLLIMPVIIIISFLREKEIKLIFTTFIVAVLFSSLYCFYDKLGIIEKEDLPFSVFFYDQNFQNLNFSMAIPIHPAYLSSCIVLSSLVILQQFRNFSFLGRMLCGLLLLFFFVTLLILMARATLFAIGAIGVVYFLLKLKRSDNIAYPILAIAASAALIYCLVLFVPNLSSRLTDSFANYQYEVFKETRYTSVSLHFRSWHCAIKTTLTSSHFFLGHGTGDEENTLVGCYAGYSWDEMARVRFDAHNEYLSSFVRHGVIGVLIWIFCLGFSAYTAIRQRSLLYLTFVVLVAVAAFSESILRGQVPLLFYAFFNAAIFRLVWLHSTLEADSLPPEEVSSPVNSMSR